MEVTFARTEQELDEIIGLRFEILRKPWAQPLETATDDLENSSHNAMIRMNETLVACGRLQDNGGGTGQVRYMAVAGSMQGKGLGKKILEALEKKARNLSLMKVELQARENAVPFYLAQGYVIREKSFLLWGQIQHFLMEKKLN